MTPDTGMWHYGLIARLWAEFNLPEPDEVAYYAAAIRRFGEPALDLGCGTGRILQPLLAEGLDVDGTDVSPDMIGHARRHSDEAGFKPGLAAQAIHERDIRRRYRTIYDIERDRGWLERVSPSAVRHLEAEFSARRHPQDRSEAQVEVAGAEPNRVPRDDLVDPALARRIAAGGGSGGVSVATSRSPAGKWT